MTRDGKSSSVVGTRIVRSCSYAAAGAFALVATIYLVRAFDSRGQLDLGPEHRVRFEAEFTADQESRLDWQAYQEIEMLLAMELHRRVDTQHQGEWLLDRHLSTSLTYPDNLEANWNYSYVASPSAARGVAVMLHGLTDSPYSLLATANLFVGQGYHAVVPRMPGHGFAVGGLVQADWEDWAAAVRIAVRHAQTLMAPGQPLVFVGYSNGALLAVHYALRCDDDESSPCPDSLILLSPAIAVTSFARLANLHHGVSWLPYFDKFEWQDILPEVDPFKFTSFPKNAGWQTYQLSRRTRRLLADPERVARLPPILTFQSVVDATVSGAATVDFLYNALAENGSELVVYDVNRSSTVVQMMRTPVDDPVDLMLERAPLNFSVTVLSNRDSSGTSGTEVGIIRLPAGQNTAVEGELGLVWPPGVFSLSHIAIPFRPADPLYGDGNDTESGTTESGLVLGAIAPRGERSVLALTPNYFLRLRYNPFYDFQATRIQSWLGVLQAE